MMIKRMMVILMGILLISCGVSAQDQSFTRQDTLRGSITPERIWWDLSYCHLNISVHPGDSSFTGSNLIGYRVLEQDSLMQIDLQPPMQIHKVSQDGKELEFVKDGNAWYINLKALQKQGDINYLWIEFSGKPKVSERPPWDGGVSWGRDENGNHFVATANQGEGASLWWPCKDHPYDEPDSMLISITVPDPLMNVSNGRLRSLEHHENGTNTSHWFVSNPINKYGVNINVGNYIHFGDQFQGERGIWIVIIGFFLTMK